MTDAGLNEDEFFTCERAARKRPVLSESSGVNSRGDSTSHFR